jgi:hypothetical protein
MSAIQLDQAHDPEIVAVLQWRFDELVRCGYEGCHALDIACDLDVDLHFAIDLVQRGCPSATAVRIAA